MKTLLKILAATVFSVTCLHAAQVVTTGWPSTSATAGGNSFAPQLSADGRRVVFLTAAPNLVTNLSTNWLHLVWRDLDSADMRVVTIDSNELCCQNESPLGFSVSSNGNVILIRTKADNAFVGDTNGTTDVIVRHMNAATNDFVARAIDGGTANASPFVFPQLLFGNTPLLNNGAALLSADARFVVFDSNGRNLHSQPDNNLGRDIFRRDLTEATNLMVTRSQIAAGTPRNGESWVTSITPDAQKIAFISTSGDIWYGASNALGDVYVRDMGTNFANSVHHVSAITNYLTTPYRCTTATISADGSSLAIIAASDANEGAKLFHYTLDAATLTVVATNADTNSTPRISSNGRFIIHTDGTNLLRWDAVTATNEVVSVTTNGTALSNIVARFGDATPDANLIAFIAASPQLTAEASPNRQIYLRDMAAGTTRVLSMGTNGPCRGVEHFTTVSVSADGTGFAFDTAANDLVAGDHNNASDVFVRDLTTGSTILVTPALATAQQRTTGSGHAALGASSFSADGRFLAFLSHDSTLVRGDTNGRTDVFISDLLTGACTNVPFSSTNMNAVATALSGDGQHVVTAEMNFASYYGGSSGSRQVKRFNRQTQEDALLFSTGSSTSGSAPAVSSNGAFFAYANLQAVQPTFMVSYADGTTNVAFANSGGTVTLRGHQQDGAFTPDGRYVLFMSTADLTTNGSSGQQLYAFDLTNRTIRMLSTNTGFSGPLAISQNSRYVAFQSVAWSSSIYSLHRYDLLTGVSRFIAQPAVNPAITADGRFIAFEQYNQVQVFDCDSNAQTVVSIRTTDQAVANAACKHPTISADGRFVTFISRATNLVPGTTPGPMRLYIRDRLLGVTTLGAAGNADISVPIPSPDGRTIAFQSVASDLVPGDYNDKRDIFVLRLGVDSDGDGLDDDWEVAFFNSLSRDGFGDFDNDGVNDRAEFLAGTDPTNSNSVLRVLAVQALGSGGTKVTWTGNPDRSYRLEYKADAGAPNWAPLNATINWNGSTATTFDTSATNAQRFYRAVRLP